MEKRSRVLGSLLASVIGLLLSGHGYGSEELAFPGYSGFLNVPSAYALERGTAAVQYSDQGWINGGYENRRNASAAAGLLPGVEIAARLSWKMTHARTAEVRDLSGNVKAQVPFIPEEWFALSLGVQDLGGAASNFNAVYAVAGRRIGPFEVAAGFGHPDEPGRYLDGGFAALSWRATSWLRLMAEHDAADTRLGLGVSTPARWLPGGVQVGGKVLLWDEGTSENGRQFFSLGVTIPMGRRDTSRSWDGVTAPVGEAAAANGFDGLGKSKELKEIAAAAAPTVQSIVDPATVGALLVGAGYERVAVAEVDGTLAVRFENNVFNRDERDALWDVAVRLHKAYPQLDRVYLVLLNQGLVVARRLAVLSADEPRMLSGGRVELEGDWQQFAGNGPVWKPRLTISPRLTSAIGTEVGVWDASYAIETEWSSSLWHGALASVALNTAVYNSDDFEQGEIFYPQRQRDGVRTAELQQAFIPHQRLVTAFYAGRYLHDYRGWLNETLLFSDDRRHALGFIGGNFWHDSREEEPRQMLGRYSYYHPERDIQLHVYAGEFFYGDRGVRAETRFWFGDYAIDLIYKNTDAQFFGLGVVLPLTPTRDRQWRYLQVRGNPDWSYSVNTRVGEDRNELSFSAATMVRSPNSLDRLYLNRLRLAP